jgi:hypothetical protein
MARVWLGYSSALFVGLGMLRPRVHRDDSRCDPNGEIGLMIEWSWWIEDEWSIACGKWSDKDLRSPP